MAAAFGRVTVLFILAAAAAATEVLLPSHGCPGLAAELCAPWLSAHPLTAVALSPLLTGDECAAFIAAAEAGARGGAGWRSVLRFDTREVPLGEVPELRRWYNEQGGCQRLLALIRAHHLPQPAAPSAEPVVLELFDSNVVKYSFAPGGSRCVQLHSDGEGVFTFNVLLSSPDDFGAGPEAGALPASSAAGRVGVGTYFAHLNRTVHAGQGQALTYYGGLVHSSAAPLGRGVRYIWQGFLRPAQPAPLESELSRVAAPLARAGVLAAQGEAGPSASAALPPLLSNLCAVLGRVLEREPAAREGGGREREAREACEAALAAEPSAGAYNNLGLLLGRAGDAPAAERALRAGLSQLSAGGADAMAARAAAEAAELWTNLCVLLTEQSRAAEAVGACEAALELAPNAPALHANLGAACAHAEPARARRAFLRALELEPGAAGARFNLAALELRAGSAAEAVSHFAALLAAEPHDDEARAGLGAALVRLGRYDEAIALGRDALRRDHSPR